MSNSINVKQQFVKNNVPNQTLSYANQLTVQQWNTIINTLTKQVNDTTTYLKDLHQWLIGFNNTDSYSVVPDGLSLFKYIITTRELIPTNISQLANDRDYATLQQVDTAVSSLKNAAVQESKTYTDKAVSNKANKEDVPTKVLQLENDADYVNLETLNTYNDNLIDYVDEQVADLVTTDTEQTITAKKKFEGGIELTDDDGTKGRISTKTNNTGMLGAENQHFKVGYINDIRANAIFPVKKDGGGLIDNASLGGIGNDKYRWLSAYIDNIYSKNITINGDNAATEKYVRELISNMSTLNLETVNSLPEADISSSTIYLLKTDTTDETNVYEEWIYVKNKWELIGTTKADLGINEDDVLNIINSNSQDIEEMSNEVEELSFGKNSSVNWEDDTQVPSSKAVKEYVDSVLGDIETLLGGI